MNGPAPSRQQCPSCRATLALCPQSPANRCPLCDHPELSTPPESPIHPHPPTFTLPFRITPEEAAEAVQEWIANQKLTPFGLRQKTPSLLTQIYLPAFIYSCTAHSHFQASIAEFYKPQPKKDHPTQNPEPFERRSLKGNHITYLVDTVIPASKGIPASAIQNIEPFSFDDLQRFQPGQPQPTTIEENALTTQDSLRLAHEQAEQTAKHALEHFLPGDGQLELTHTTVLREESLEPVLLPSYVLTLRHHPQKPPLLILANGQTGQVHGTLPTNQTKLTLVLAVTLASLTTLAWLITLAWNKL